tara:strand:- start:2465 stop:2773 length:309 start_codon:yes stop_codon:yes gene_type:complete
MKSIDLFTVGEDKLLLSDKLDFNTRRTLKSLILIEESLDDLNTVTFQDPEVIENVLAELKKLHTRDFKGQRNIIYSIMEYIIQRNNYWREEEAKRIKEKETA